MKVLHILSSKSFSGAENVACQIIKMFDGEVEMAYTSLDGSISESLKEIGIKFYPLNKISSKEIKRIIKEYNPDIIHAHDIRASVVIAFSVGKKPIISHIHGKFTDMSRLSPKSILYRLALCRIKRVIVVSNSALTEYAFKNALSKKCTVLYNVIDKNALYSKMESDPRNYNYDIVFLGRMTYPKNPQRLLQVLKKVIDQLPTVKIGVIGDGDLKEEIQILARELKIDKNIVFTGFMRNPIKALSMAKVMVMTSRTEGTPMVVLEAMLLGVPVVSTPTDGIKEIVVDGETGFLSDDDDVLANSIHLLLTNEDLRKNISKKSLKVAIDLNNINNYKDKLCYIYKSCVKDIIL